MWNQLSPLGKLFLAVLGGIGLYEGVKYMNKKRIFVSFAIEDQRMRDLLAGQARNESSPFEFVDMSVKEPWESSWKTKCRERIKSCDGVIALISKNTSKAEGARWEIKCAQEEGIPIMPMYVSDTAKSGPLLPELKGKRIHDWSWKNIDKFILSLSEIEKDV